MILELRRPRTTDGLATIGELFIDDADERECYTLEDLERFGEKVHGQTAIPTGLYKIIITMSPHFGRPLPLIVNVPGFDGVRIHPGNTTDDTEGCLLVGQTRTEDTIGESRAAFNQLYLKIQDVLDRQQGEVWLNVTHA